ncbi:hypothetical protein PMKS-001776 [Pichia membranifaciens]|uniref:Uncharacterized protein n=1 Tax=Pichia membranifaciens TaxID=4926 RepID=A0A1Q2YFQ2_9ASCO|nr:hypothetical protein PMKS-001776 [Pichia membranifaciens]
MAILIWENAFRRLLILLILLLFALLLLYTDYLQEVNFYQNKLQLGEFKVNFDTYKLLKESSLLSQHQLKTINAKLESGEHDIKVSEKDKNGATSILKSKRKRDKTHKVNKQQSFKDKSHVSTTDELQYFSLNPPFPEIDLTSIGPVFLENGLAHLYCEYSFDTIRCTVGGRIPAEKIYFPTAYFTNPNFESIVVSFGWRELLKFFTFYKLRNKKEPKDAGIVEHIGWIDEQILKPNIMNIELLTNYIMLFGSNGTNMNLFNGPTEVVLEDESETDLSISKKFKYYTFIHTQICVLFILIYLKLVNFILFSFSLLFHFSVHIPIYIFNFFKYGKHNDQLSADSYLTSDTSMSGFEEWISNNENVEALLLNEGLAAATMQNCKSHFYSYSGESELRLRKVSPESQSTYGHNDGYSTGIQESVSTRIQDVRKLYEWFAEEPENSAYSPLVQSGALSPSPIKQFTGDIENQVTSISTNKFRESENTLISGNTLPPGDTLNTSSLNDLVDKYYLFYLLICLYFLMHLVVYEIVNFVTYNLISGIFEVIRTSDPNNLNVKVKTIFQVPKILVDPAAHRSSIMIGSTSKSVLTHGNQIFDSLLNIFGCVVNVILALLFHSIYTFCIYTYTISIY